jgi:hypothetical protein
MDKENIEGLAGEITQDLIDHCVISEAQKCSAKMVVYMRLDRELLKPLEKVCTKLDEQRFKREALRRVNSSPII